MVQSEKYYMITINQSPEDDTPEDQVKEGLLKFAREKASRWLLATEEGSINGKTHFHLTIELLKETRKDNIRRGIQTYTKVLKTNSSIDVRGTRGIPHKESWETFSIDYVAKDCNYETNMDNDWIQEQIEKRKLKTLVDQRSIYIDRPKFWKLYREYLINRRRRVNMCQFQNLDAQEVFHGGMQEILAIYTPLWLKPDIVVHIINYQEGLTQYGEALEDAANKHLLALSKPMEVEIVRRV